MNNTSMSEISSSCAPTVAVAHRNVRTRVALGSENNLARKIDERAIKAKTQPMKITRLRACPSVGSVARPNKPPVYVLFGVHSPTVLYDDDGVRSQSYRPANCPVAFYLARSAMVYENLPGTIPVACSCGDFVMRSTSTRNQRRVDVPRSVNDRNAHGDAAIMGAVLGCKHMMAAAAWIRDGGF